MASGSSTQEKPEPPRAAPVRVSHAGSRAIAILLLLAFAALLLHGYHPYAEDAEIYVPAVVHALHPSSYPVGRQFFEAQSRWTVFTGLVVWSVRLTRLPLAWVFFLWQLASIFLLLYASWKIASKCFPGSSARWGAVAMVAALLTLPVAGTSLYILDQYFNPRSLSAFGVLFAIDAMLESKPVRAGLWLVFTALVHPLMAVFAVSYLLLLYFFRKLAPVWGFLGAAVFFPQLSFKKPSAAYLEVLARRPGLFLLRWHWYEWLGALAPLALLYCFSRIARRKRRTEFEQLAASMALFGLIYLAGALIISIPQSLILFIRFQPMRSLLLVYLFLAILGGGLLAESWLTNRPLRWLLLFIPLCVGMGYAQFQLFPSSRHVEWPGAAPRNPWSQAFLWIRGHTPRDAVFALDPRYMAIPGEDNQGFEAIAERSRLANAGKSMSIAVLFPGLPLADVTLAQVRATAGWKNFTPADFERLKRTYGVTWLALQQPGVAGMTCPYRNKAVLVCRLSP